MRTLVIPAALTAALLASPASAAWMETVDTVTMPTTPVVHLATPVSLDAYVGPVSLNGNNWDYAWCIDLYHEIYLGLQVPLLSYSVEAFDTSPYTQPLLTSGQAKEIAGLAEQGDLLLFNGIGNPSDIGEATQLAIWSVEYSNFTYSGASDAVNGLVTQYLAEGLSSNHGLAWTSEDGHQTFATVPEPMTLTVFGTGLLGLGLLRRRAR